MEPYNPFKPIPSLSGTAAINEYLSKEGDFVAAEGYKDSEKNLKHRQYVLKFLQIRSKQHEEFDSFTPYLALNYFDRFISKTGWPGTVEKDVSKDLELFATSCLLQAGRIRNQNFSSDEFMRKIRQGGLDFEERQITNMEKLIVDILKKEMRLVTAFCFLQHFLSYLPLKPENIEELIIQSHTDIYLAELRPSVITVSAILVGVRKKVHDFELESLIKNEMIIKCNMKEEQVDLCTSKVALLLEKRKSMVRGDRICEPGSVQPSSSSALPLSEVAEASTTSKEIPADFQKQRKQGRVLGSAQQSSSKDNATQVLSSSAHAGSEVEEASSPKEGQSTEGERVADSMSTNARK